MQKGVFIERVALLFLTIKGTATTRVAEYAEEYEIRKDPIGPKGTVADMVDLIKRTGIKNNILAADLGQIGNIAPVEGLKIACKLLMEHGLTEQEIKLLTSENPSELLGLRK